VAALIWRRAKKQTKEEERREHFQAAMRVYYATTFNDADLTQVHSKAQLRAVR
jgi:hypothetical protein